MPQLARAEDPAGTKATRTGERVLFNVTDTGIGMTAEELGRLVQPFSQADPSTPASMAEAGSGWRSARRSSPLLVGSIRVDSIEGSGSSFYVVLPRLTARGSPA